MTGPTPAPDLVLTAITLEDRAARIDELADTLAARATAAAWQGPASDRFRSTAADRRQQLRAAADVLRQLAQQARLVAASAP